MQNLEGLESRVVLSVSVTIDYTHDTQNFFNTQEKKDLLQLAADTITARLQDTLDAINPGGGNSWTATFTHPGTGASQPLQNLQVDADEYIIYAGGRQLGATLGIGGPGAFNVGGSQQWLDAVSTRGEAGVKTDTDFARWGGAITFDVDSVWHFGETTDGLVNGENDFLSVALHELLHAIGFGTAASWQELVDSDENEFLGPKSNAEYDGQGNPPTSPDEGHWADGTTDGGDETVMDPVVTQGTRKTMTDLDFAGLDDIGWEVGEPKPVISIEATDKSAKELNRNRGVYSVTRTGDTDDALTVSFIKKGTATPKLDYRAIGSSVIIPAGESSATIIIKPKDDELVEGAEFVRLILKAKDAYTIDSDNDRGKVNIADNDQEAAFAPGAHAALSNAFASSAIGTDSTEDLEDLIV